MAAVGDNIRALHNALTRRSADNALEWNAGGHFKDVRLADGKGICLDYGEGNSNVTILIDADGCPVVDLTVQTATKYKVPVLILCDTAHQIQRDRCADH